ncbi:MAG TPA: hypothetical protein VMB03_14820 [Bryobacteraceae bacterium]|nr:hypothetical protein [Bryobacteraceae bacterium]
MNFADVLVFALLAAADICLIVYLRRRRARYMRMDRMTRSLQLHIRRETTPEAIKAQRRAHNLQRVS